MSSFGHTNPSRGPRGSRYPGTFLLALREALAKLNWQPLAWKGTHVECVDGEGKSQHVGLENLYRRLRREARDTWPEQIAELLGSVNPEAATPPAHLSEVADRLLVRLGPPIKPDNPDTDVWSMPLVEHCLVATLVIDYPSSMSYVTQKMIADTGESGSIWLERGIANLRAKSTAEGMPMAHPESGLMQGQFGDAYDSSRALLLDELLPGHDEYGFYVIVPGRDHLLVLPISAQTLPLAPWLRAIAGKTYHEMPYPISPELFWVRGGVWRLFEIEMKGDDVVVNPPPEFVDVVTALQPDIDVNFGDEPDADDSGPVSI